MPGEPWSADEVDAIVADYFAMLEMQLLRQPVNKSLHRRELQRVLNHRSEGSIERKHQNISAILLEARFPYIIGYKPLSNYQGLLSDAVIERLDEDATIRALALAYVETPVDVVMPSNVLARMVEPPNLLESVRVALAGHAQKRYARKIDFIARETQNRILGAAGEDFVVSFERARLEALGLGSLAASVERVSVSRGDGLGFDVRSFLDRHREKFIEVKTTQLGAATPFYLTSNEVAFSSEYEEQFSLYRVYSFGDDPMLFSLDGALNETCDLRTTQYAALPRIKV